MGILMLDKAQITSLHTNAAFTRRGFARRMVEHLLTIAKEHKLKEVSVEASLLAVQLYVSAGFVKGELKRFPLARGEKNTVYVCRKSLQ